jgi:hypothetical protein
MPLSITAPPYFCQLFLRDSEDSEGWSEGYWINQATYDQALAALKVLTLARLAYLTPEIFVDYLRVSSSDLKGDTVIAFPDVTNQQGVFKQGNNPIASLPSDICAYVRFTGQVNVVGPPARVLPVHTIRPIHGVARSAVMLNTDQQLDPASFWYAAIFNSLTALIARGWLYEVSKPPVLAATTKWQVLGFDIKLKLGRRKVGRPFGQPSGRLVAR